MSSQKPNFFKILRQQHRLLYKLCCCIVLIYITLNIAKIEVPPLFLSMMYSVPIENKDTQTVYEFRYNDDQLWAKHDYIHHHQRITFYYTIDYYSQSIQYAPPQAADGVKFKQMVKHSDFGRKYADQVYSTSEDITSYPDWLQTYMSEIINEPIARYTVLKKTVIFDKSDIRVAHIDTIIKYPES